METAPLRLMELPAPELGPGEILIRVEVCGVCRTDLHITEGELSPHLQPILPAHEIVGRVAILTHLEKLEKGSEASK